MTSAKSAVPFRGEQKLGSLDRELQRKLRDRDAREMFARSHARFLRPHRGVVTRESQFITAFRDRCMSCGLLPGAKYSYRAAGVVDRPASQPELLRDNI